MDSDPIIATFSVAGSLKGIRDTLDLLGIATLGIITSLGGGMLSYYAYNTHSCYCL